MYDFQSGRNSASCLVKELICGLIPQPGAIPPIPPLIPHLLLHPSVHPKRLLAFLHLLSGSERLTCKFHSTFSKRSTCSAVPRQQSTKTNATESRKYVNDCNSVKSPPESTKDCWTFILILSHFRRDLWDIKRCLLWSWTEPHQVLHLPSRTQTLLLRCWFRPPPPPHALSHGLFSEVIFINVWPTFLPKQGRHFL